MAAEAQEQELWLPRMSKAFIALEGSAHAIDTAAFATAMQEVRVWRGQRPLTLSLGCTADALAVSRRGRCALRRDSSMPGPTTRRRCGWPPPAAATELPAAS